jgi:hypothetical protein
VAVLELVWVFCGWRTWCSKGKWFEFQREHICPGWKHLGFFSSFSSNKQTYHVWESNVVYVSWFQTSSLFWIFYAFLWVIPRRLNFICRIFGTLFHLHRRVGMKDNLGWECWGISLINTPTFSSPVILHIYLPMKMEQIECSETSAYKIQTSGNYFILIPNSWKLGILI